MRRRPGRKRKAGKRHPSGDVILERRASPLEVAQAMPHRRALGGKAADQRAENELGRMVLRGEVEEVLGTAWDLYRGEWKAYIASLAAPRALAVGGGRAKHCDGCLVLRGGDFCLCELRKRRWNETRAALAETGATGPTGNRYGDAAGHCCLAVADAETHVMTLETGSNDRLENMQMFASAALNLLLQRLSQQP